MVTPGNMAAPANPAAGYTRICMLTRMPNCLLRCITDFLPDESVSLLALTCRDMAASLPVAKTNGDATARERFLDILAKDLDHQIHCMMCKKLHDPLDSLINSSPGLVLPSSTTDRAKIASRACGKSIHSITSYLPRRVTPAMIDGIVKLDVKGLNYDHLLQQINTSLLSSSASCMTFKAYEVQVINGSCYLKTDQVYSMAKTTPDSDAIKMLHEALTNTETAYKMGSTGLDQPCRHFNSWDKVLHQGCWKVHREGNRNVSACHGFGYGFYETESNFDLSPRPEAACNAMKALQFCGGSGESMKHYTRWQCCACGTDFVIERFFIPGSKRLSVRLISYKMLGKGNSRIDKDWGAHGRGTYYIRKLGPSAGGVRRSFEQNVNKMVGDMIAPLKAAHQAKILTAIDVADKFGGEVNLGLMPANKLGLIADAYLKKS